MIELLTGNRLTDQVHASLKQIRNELDNAKYSGMVEGLIGWAHSAERQLRFLVARSEIDRLVFTPRCIAIVTNPRIPGVLDLAQAELDEATARWDAELSEVDRWLARWRHGDAIIAADTNVFLHHEEPFDVVDWHSIGRLHPCQNLCFVIPMVIVDELDRQKDVGKNDVKGRARSAVKALARLFAVGAVDQHRPLTPSTDSKGWVTVDVLADPDGRHVRMPRNDDEVVARLAHLRDLADKPVTLVTYDFGMALRARRAELLVVHLEHKS